ncbi:c-type cytochrome [Shewanella surugensis]|uniref:Cytochrome c n=1 Tax=Shewanella surugensis TaxID=212020 RepID=A0ABT0L6U0_9GAMM|nr:cytochrome c [Shewanella surugensis]MCL1123072.1 cytochrome c [Shewanella surugensis]
MKNKLTLRLLAFFTSTVMAASVADTAPTNNFKKPEDAVKYRQSAFSLMAYNFGDIGAMLKGKKPYDAATVTVRAENVAALSKLPLEGFIQVKGLDQRDALNKIWDEKARFNEKMQTLQKNASLLVVAAQSGDKRAVQKAFMETGKSCKSCHDNYKQD